MNLIYLLILFTARAEVRCGQDQAGGHVYDWCLDHNPASPDVVYVFHGGGGSERDWLERPNEPAWESIFGAAGKVRPTIIALSFGKTWLLNDMAGKPPLEATVREIMPALEAKVGFTNGRRMAWGWSMGGYNSSVLALRYPGLFHSLALECPAVGLVDPFSAPEDRARYLATLPSTARKEWIESMAGWARAAFETRENWSRHDPLRLARVAGSATRFFVTCTEEDEYDFFPGALAFVEALRARGADVEWHPLAQGTHCATNLTIEFSKIAFFTRGVSK